jgi:hypothetical protein
MFLLKLQKCRTQLAVFLKVLGSIYWTPRNQISKIQGVELMSNSPEFYEQLFPMFSSAKKIQNKLKA